MSGGHFDHVGLRIDSDLRSIAEDPDVSARFPTVAHLLEELGGWVHDLEHAIDWDLCGDTALRVSDPEFERGYITDLLRLAMRATP